VCSRCYDDAVQELERRRPARLAAWEAAGDAARRADEVGAQQEQRGGEQWDRDEGLGSVAADEGMLRAASTPYETALSSQASE